MNSRSTKQRGFRMSQVKLKKVRTKSGTLESRVDQSVTDLKKGGRPTYKYANQMVKGKTFGSVLAYRRAWASAKREFSTLPPDEQAKFVDCIGLSNASKSINALRRSLPLGVASTPWNLGTREWPLTPDLILQACEREAKANPGARVGRGLHEAIKDNLLKICDATSIKNCATLQLLLATYERDVAVIASQPCWVLHYGLCETRDADIFVYAIRVVQLLNKYAQSVSKADEGSKLLLLTSERHAVYAVLGKVSRGPQFQAYPRDGWVVSRNGSMRSLGRVPGGVPA